MYNVYRYDYFSKLSMIPPTRLVIDLLIILICNILGVRSTDHSTIHNSDGVAAVEEYCQFDVFQPKCSKNEVIVIKSATYGRMRVGKCITTEEMNAFGSLSVDTKYIGCSNDVTRTLGEKCSFKSVCDVRISDLGRVNSCMPFLNLHLEASFKCLHVIEDDSVCRVKVTHDAKHLLGAPASDASVNCGAVTNPWILESPEGQQVQVTYVSVGKSSGVNTVCSFSQGSIIDKPGKRNVSICDRGMKSALSGPSEEMEMHYLSEGNLLEIYLHQRVDHSFLLKIKATGCADIIPSEDAWLKRNKNEVVIGCYTSKQTWFLRCEDQSWVGVLGNCSSAVAESSMKTVSKHQSTDTMPADQQILIIIAISAFGVVICLVIVCIGAVYLHRYSSQGRSNNVVQRQTFPRHVLINDPSYYPSGSIFLHAVPPSGELIVTEHQFPYKRPSDCLLHNQDRSYSVYAESEDEKQPNGIYNDLTYSTNTDDVSGICNDVTCSIRTNDVKYFDLEQELTAIKETELQRSANNLTD